MLRMLKVLMDKPDNGLASDFTSGKFSWAGLIRSRKVCVAEAMNNEDDPEAMKNTEMQY